MQIIMLWLQYSLPPHFIFVLFICFWVFYYSNIDFIISFLHICPNKRSRCAFIYLIKRLLSRRFGSIFCGDRVHFVYHNMQILRRTIQKSTQNSFCVAYILKMYCRCRTAARLRQQRENLYMLKTCYFQYS